MMEYGTFDLKSTPEGDPVVVLRELREFDQVGSAWSDVLNFLKAERPKRLVLDFSRTRAGNSAGVAFFKAVELYCEQNGVELSQNAVPQVLEQLLRLAKSDAGGSAPSRTPLSPIVQIGAFAWDVVEEVHDFIGFVGLFLVRSVKSFLYIRRFRWKEMAYYLQLCGADAMPILALLSFLIGLVIAFQAAVQLRQFGANIYVADLVSLSIVRELGPLLTGVILAGRSGSAFAAEIGTMKVNEEVDALTVMGFDVVGFLALPKIYALVLAGPLLTLFADVMGIIGGIVVGIAGLDLTLRSFMQEAYMILTMPDLISGLMKSIVFALLIALIGCFRGLQTEKGADSVGRQTTSAVVSSLFLIILADAVFTVLFHVFDY